MRVLLICSLIVAIVTSASDHCNNFHSCASCVASPFCGWCSSKVVYQDGAPGHHCAGFNKNASDPFVCNGIYSTKTCTRGYECDTTNYTCALSAPGTGVSKSQCESNCSDVGKTFVCNNSSHTCEVAPPGQGTSLPICEQQCSPTQAPASHSPASHSPASHHPASPGPHSSPTPQPTVAPTFTCNTTTLKCHQAEPGEGTSKPVCEAACKPSNHTPSSLVGLWRAFPISFTTEVEEKDFLFATDSVEVATASSTETLSVVSVGSEVWLEKPGSVLKCIYQMQPGLPETFELILACGAEAPASIEAAMSGSGDQAWFLSQCVNDGYCKFHLGPHNSSRQLLRAAEHLVQNTDPCSQYGSNCTECLTHEYCGWCSTNVVYSDGSVGTRCAGFNNSGGKNAFTCTGSYSTEMCYPGYECDAVNQTCSPVAPGNGQPKSACMSSCKARPGPPTQLTGKWRGIVVNNGYPFGVIVVNIEEDNVTITEPDGSAVSGTIKHVAGQVFIKFTSGPNSGAAIAGIYTIQQIDVITYIDLAFGGANSDAPTEYKTPMRPPGMELVLAKCTASGCPW